ncbi:hydroxymethylpyrimidine/phosphomethylpyrimidine kinase, partial [candidate division CSSED10-310 bacterium]
MAAHKKAINVLSIGGTDPCSFSGLSIDHKTFLSLGVTGSFITTVVTAQNTHKFHAFFSVPPTIIQKQLQSIVEERKIAALKTGLIPSPKSIYMLGEGIKNIRAPLVVDPVLGSSTGRSFVRSSLLEGYRRILLPLATLVTPNLHEAAVLTGKKLVSSEQIKAAAKQIYALGPGAVLIKGGHRRGDPIDILWDGSAYTYFRSERIGTYPWRGLGCTLSAAITAFLDQITFQHQGFDLGIGGDEFQRGNLLHEA